MSFRSRLFLALLVGVLLPLGVLAWGVRREMSIRLTDEYERRIGAIVAVIRADVATESRAIGARLDALAGDLAGDTRARLAARGDAEARRWLIDYAGSAMRTAGLDLLQIHDGTGRIVSSGHFRNDFDRPAPAFASGLRRAGPGGALVRVATAEGAFIALARADSARVAGDAYVLIGGVRVDSAWLARLSRDPDLRVSLALATDSARGARPAAGGADSVATGERVVARLALPFVDGLAAEGTAPATASDSAHIVVTQRPGALDALRRTVDLWFGAALAIVGGLAVVLAAWLARRVSRPLGELAEKTAAIDLDRLDQDFATDRSDEIGALSRVLGAMSDRLRAGAARLRDVERRAAVGDVARQVNHDVKNGLVPIRHVLRHLAQVARDEPAALPGIFAERQETLESSVRYLEELARKYARLSPAMDQERCDPNAVAREVAQNADPRGGKVTLELGAGVPPVHADAIVLRRILENLVGNAIDSLGGDGGQVTVRTERAGDDKALARLSVSDTGRGMTRAELDRAFEDFHTTKPDGTGLGLSVVRRLVADLGGTLRVETEPGAGTRFTIDLPGAG